MMCTEAGLLCSYKQACNNIEYSAFLTYMINNMQVTGCWKLRDCMQAWQEKIKEAGWAGGVREGGGGVGVDGGGAGDEC